MRKFCLAIATIVTFLFAPIALADSQNSNAKDYYSSKHPKETTKLNVAAKELPMTAKISPTNITLTNASSDLIYAVVPGSQVYDPVYPRNNIHIYNDYLYDDTYLVLKDPYAATFYNGFVCRRAMMTVYGQPGYYSVYIDREFCN